MLAARDNFCGVVRDDLDGEKNHGAKESSVETEFSVNKKYISRFSRKKKKRVQLIDMFSDRVVGFMRPRSALCILLHFIIFLAHSGTCSHACAHC
jgi:hypothetical protein